MEPVLCETESKYFGKLSVETVSQGNKANVFKQNIGFIHTTASKLRNEGVEIPHNMFLVVGNISTSVASDSSEPVQNEEDHMWLPLQQKHIRGTSSWHRT
jgi:hypothetical protein